MRRQYLGILFLGSTVIAAAPAIPQSFPDLGSAGGALSGLTGGGNSGLLGNLVPGVANTTTGNAAGVLSYCLKNKFLGGGDATSALSGLLGKKGVKSSRGFAAGQNGNLLTGQGNRFSLNSVQGGLKSKICDLVLEHARSLL